MLTQKKRRRETLQQNKVSSGVVSSEKKICNQETLPSYLLSLPGFSNKKYIIVLRNTELFLDRSNKKGVSKAVLQEDGHYADEKLKSTKTIFSPSVVHQCLLMLLDSPLNKCGYLSIFLQNTDSKIIWISPEFRIPRTWTVFSKVMGDFLKSSNGELVTTSGENLVLLKLLEPSVLQYIYSRKLVRIVSGNCKGRFCRLRKHTDRLLSNNQVSFIIELFSSKPLEPLGIDYSLKLSMYPIAASVLCNRLCNELEIVENI